MLKQVFLPHFEPVVYISIYISFLFIVPPLAMLMHIVCVSSHYFLDPSHCAYIISKNVHTIHRGYNARRAQSLYRLVTKLHSMYLRLTGG